ncbi:SDR family oxidoreductase [Streptomyces sp. NPDC048527]|uniref:SDR family oxidoreductase n=1 Tax=Streptomyces sp. NPDC048527 TaxID=3365568 RepID=UPI0037156F87
MEAAISKRTALVGGGSSGIGYAAAEHLARSGHRVVITGRRADPLESAATALRESTGSDVEALVNDVSDPDGAAAAVKWVEERHGALDVLVLNAGGPPPGRILDVGDDQWQQAYELLLLGPLRLARLVMPRMAARGFGRVLFVTSSAVRQPQPDLATSVVLRSAVTAAAKLLARECAAEGVTVNCVAPGATATARREQILENRARTEGKSYAELDAADAAAVPAGRAGRPEEIAAVLEFLASEAAGYVNGTVITVDGGRTETI